MNGSSPWSADARSRFGSQLFDPRHSGQPSDSSIRSVCAEATWRVSAQGPAPSFIMLRVAAPRVPSVRIFIARLQTDQQPIDRAGIDIAFRERGLERHRMFQRVGEGQRAVMLFDLD